MYAAKVEGQRLTFHAEAVWRRNMIMRDRETGTLWQQATGEALIGRLEGASLEILPAERIQWGDWLQAHPDSKLTGPPERWYGALSLEATHGVLQRATDAFAPPGLSPADARLPWDQAVLGFEMGGQAAALPLAAFKVQPLLHEQINGVPLLLVRAADSGEPRVFIRAQQSRFELVDDHLVSGNQRYDLAGSSLSPGNSDLEQIPHQYTRWLGWFEFHPDTVVIGTKS